MSGSRGPLTKATSVRGMKSQRKEPAVLSGAAPKRPDWFKDAAAWDAVIRDLRAAGVPLQQVDGTAIGMYLLTVDETRKAAESGDTRLAARLGRDALRWAGEIGATVASRERMSIRPTQTVDTSPWARIGPRK